MKYSVILTTVAAAVDVLALLGTGMVAHKPSTSIPTTRLSISVATPTLSQAVTTPSLSTLSPSVSVAPISQASNNVNHFGVDIRNPRMPAISAAPIYQGNMQQIDAPGIGKRGLITSVVGGVTTVVGGVTTVVGGVTSTVSGVKTVVGGVTTVVGGVTSVVGGVTTVISSPTSTSSSLPVLSSATANIRGNCTKTWSCSVAFNGTLAAILTDSKNYTGNTQIAGGCNKGVCWGSIAAAGSGYAPIKLTCNNGGQCTGSGNGSVQAYFSNSSGIIQYGWYVLGGSCSGGVCNGHLVTFGDPSY